MSRDDLEPGPRPGGPSPEQELSARFLRDFLRSVDSIFAVVDTETWHPILESAKFFEYFPPDPAEPDGPLDARIDAMDADKAADRIERGRPYSVDVEVSVGPRTRSLSLAFHKAELDGRSVVIIEATDLTKAKETEYMLDSYSRMAEKNARDLQREKERAEKLLLNIMPRAVFEEMKDFGSVSPQRFDNATILMLDFVDFTEMAVSRNPGELVSELNDIFSAFDRIVELFGCERMKTIGDAYMAVSGIPEANDEHAQAIARVALRMRRYLQKRNESRLEPWLGRIGIHSGPVVGSIVGVQKYVYDIFGPGVNMAARLEAFADPMQVVISSTTHNLLEEEFTCSDLGEHPIKGFGTQALFALESEYQHRR
jgi:adenylate cyclase